jgi:hypothetical protein
MGTFAQRLVRSIEPMLGRLGYVRVKEPLPPGAPVIRFTDRDLRAAAVLKAWAIIPVSALITEAVKKAKCS